MMHSESDTAYGRFMVREAPDSGNSASLHGAVPAVKSEAGTPYSRRSFMDEEILIVDHESDIRRSLKSVLSENGYRVRTASDRLKALDVFEGFGPALVIVETRLEGHAGLDLIRQFKAMDADVEVIVLTGNATLDNAVRAMRGNGASDFLTKPLNDISQLLQSVNQALVRHRANRERSLRLSRLNDPGPDLRAE